ncbi:XrtA/PEP-CTERM system histidine kinase PrsK [Massilia varians]|uniref:XrtA/PEP-CTERM system histidine kinase PrsK n=1 Tax=Massilia varians TaxID=457921 RepID=UPI0025578817|nr:XrtA/PEP-CTERM system histidine kinase PrsK [Massilia varians]MDK6078665.1 PEP-CTERM system histidine kinase PrsK [Massilia varians]
MTSIAVYSYSVAAAAFFLLGVLLLALWRGGAFVTSVTIACTLTALWAGVVAWDAFSAQGLSAWSEALEMVRNGAWSAMLVLMLGHYRDPAGFLGLRRPILLGIAAYLLLLLARFVLPFDLMYRTDAGLVPNVMVRVCMAVLGMLLVEQVYRNKTVQERWMVKFACLGIGAMFGYDFYMYTHAMLFHELSPEVWDARGVVSALAVPLIGTAVKRSKSMVTPLAVSRRVMFHSAALLGSAIYLLAMGSAGYYLKFFGGDWGTLMQVVFLCGALLLLAGVLFSGAFRAWLKVFISKHFYSYGYDYREEWMRFTRTLSEHGPNLGERAVEAVAALVESPGGALWQRRGNDVYEPVASWQATARDSEPADSNFCRFLESTQWVIDLHEYRALPEKYGDLVLPDWLAAFPRAWVVVPLILHGKLFGFVVLQDSRSQVALNWEVFDLLEIAGSQAASYLALQDAANDLMVARQFESFNRMSTFVVHDLKNLVSQLSLMNANAEKHRDNPEFQRDMLDTVTHSIQKMKMMLQKLSRNDAPVKPLPLTVDRVVRQAIALKDAFEPRPVLQVENGGLQVLADSERLERVLGHLIQNAIEATPKSGRVTVSVRHRDGCAVVEIADTGSGMSEEFIRERLFKPFESTKPAGMGIGLFESREYINELGGTLELASAPAAGTTFTVSLPLYSEEARNVGQAA